MFKELEKVVTSLAFVFCELCIRGLIGNASLPLEKCLSVSS